ncbi:hypothetical protein [Actinacidiphila sp. ITFR-21]|uniref:hypothetical protein n=1 Tax=Actinacidiphila sp. ITFR-21 TaxID=3075199 RepID=UPI0028890B07|nr:hypothetical protein [Streptomyces sp. ITFR-21]WNI19926.1 hypothetical protein RLT57_30750 [Streptomyces sp. ITFR-21]
MARHGDIEIRTPDPCTRTGAAWRCVTVLVLTLLLISAGAWLGSTLIGPDARLAMIAVGPAASPPAP